MNEDILSKNISPEKPEKIIEKNNLLKIVRIRNILLN